MSDDELIISGFEKSRLMMRAVMMSKVMLSEMTSESQVIVRGVVFLLICH